MNLNEKRILAHVIKLAHQHGYIVHSVYDGDERRNVPDNVGANPLGIGLGPAFARQDLSKPDLYLQRVTEWAYDELNALDEGLLWFNVPDNAPANGPDNQFNPGYRPRSKKLWVFFIWGNGNNGCDCITDHVAFDHFDQTVMDPACKMAERLSEGQITFADVLVGEVFLDRDGSAYRRINGNYHTSAPNVLANAAPLEAGPYLTFNDNHPVGVAPV